MSKSKSKPTFVLVHGAWHSPQHFGLLISSLESHGYRAVAPALPSVSDASHGVPVEDSTRDIEAVRAAIIAELDDQGNDVIVVPHSYGGIVAMGAVEGLDRRSRCRSREKRNSGVSSSSSTTTTTTTTKKEADNIDDPTTTKTTTVVAIAGITAFLLPRGQTIYEIERRPAGRPATPPLFAPPPGSGDLFYHDIASAAEREKWTSLLRPISSAALWDASRFSGHEVLPVHFLLATADRAVPLATQRDIVAGLALPSKGGGERGVRTETLDGASHSPFLSRVVETTDFLRRCAGEEI